jgi:hypothetical protein
VPALLTDEARVLAWIAAIALAVRWTSGMGNVTDASMRRAGAWWPDDRHRT